MMLYWPPLLTLIEVALVMVVRVTVLDICKTPMLEPLTAVNPACCGG